MDTQTALSQQQMLESIVEHGREYRALYKSRASLRQRVRARLIHICQIMAPPPGGHSKSNNHSPNISQEAGHNKGINHDGLISPPGSQLANNGHGLPIPQEDEFEDMEDDGEDLAEDNDQPKSKLPAWLKKAPSAKILAKEHWHPTLALSQSPACVVLMELQEIISFHLRAKGRQIGKATETLPIWTEMVSQIRGVSSYQFGRIIAESRSFAEYPTKQRLFKRLGLAAWEHTYVWDEDRNLKKIKDDPIIQKKVTDGEVAEGLGYNPERRSVTWNTQGGLIKQNRDEDGNPLVYRQIYLDRKVYEKERDPEMRDFYVHRRAARFMVKAFIRDVWRFWRDMEGENAS